MVGCGKKARWEQFFKIINAKEDSGCGDGVGEGGVIEPGKAWRVWGSLGARE